MSSESPSEHPAPGPRRRPRTKYPRKSHARSLGEKPPSPPDSPVESATQLATTKTTAEITQQRHNALNKMRTAICLLDALRDLMRKQIIVYTSLYNDQPEPGHIPPLQRRRAQNVLHDFTVSLERANEKCDAAWKRVLLVIGRGGSEVRDPFVSLIDGVSQVRDQIDSTVAQCRATFQAVEELVRRGERVPELGTATLLGNVLVRLQAVSNIIEELREKCTMVEKRLITSDDSLGGLGSLLGDAGAHNGTSLEPRTEEGPLGSFF